MNALSSRAARPATRRTVVTGILLACTLTGNAWADAFLPPIGGRGGAQFIARCPQGQLLTGFELRTGNDVDSIRPICVIAYGPARAGLPEKFPQAFGGPESAPSYFFPALPKHPLTCPGNAPIVTGLYVRSEGATTVVNNIHLFCGVAATVQTPSAYPAAVFDGPAYAQDGPKGTQYCPAGLVAVGINGRSGIWLDALGLICGEPHVTSTTLPGRTKLLGRVNSGTTSGPSISICEAARRARARNSVAAPGLESQCRAAGAAGERPSGVVLPIVIGTSETTQVSGAIKSRVVLATQAPPQPAPGQSFAPPLFDDGAQLWACADAADGDANGAQCAGLASGDAYCRMRGYSGALQQRANGAPGVLVAVAQADIPVLAVNGDVCAAGDCTVISQLHCAR